VQAALFVLAPMFLAASGETRPLGRCVPADAMVAYFGRPSPEMLEGSRDGTVDKLAGWVITLMARGVIPREGRVIADVIGTLPTLARRPHAWVLLDVTAKQVRPEVYRLKDMQTALLIDGGGLSVDIDRRLRDLLATYTDAGHARIEKVHAGDVHYHRLTDQRLPEWAVAEWGEVGQQFLLTFGEGAFTRMLDVLQGRTPVLADDPWFRQAHTRCRGATSGIEVHVNFAGIRARVGQVVKGRPAQVLRSLGLERADRLIWTVGFDGRALRSEVMAREVDGPDHYAMLTGKEITAPEVTAAIPPEAGAYAAFRFPLSEAVRSARHAYLSSRSPGARRRLREGWGRLEQKFDFDVQAGLIDRLGNHLVIHTYPRHPLGLPMLCTVWIQFAGDRAVVARTLDRMMAAWQHQLEGPPDKRPTIGLSPQIKRDEDGLWYLQLGLVGPAMGVADGWIVISFSPEAVRTNLRHLAALDGSAPEGE